MRPARLAVIALATAALTACGTDITSPSTRFNGAPSLTETCRAGYLTSTGKCSGGSSQAKVAPTTIQPIAKTEDGCRAGYLTSTGRCE